MAEVVLEANYRPDTSNPNCPSRRLLDLIADKWTTLVIVHLADGPLRYSQLYRQVGGISHKMLSQTLRELERLKLVRRSVFESVPPQVEYALTEVGQTLLPPLLALTQWAEEHLMEVELVGV